MATLGQTFHELYNPAEGLLNAGAVRPIGETFVATAYGPPWGGIEGSGVTARGTRLSPGVIPKTDQYIIAVDPSVIPLGSRVYVWPNPFGYYGTFLADDTGGAIKGHRIDIYDPRGRFMQNSWGRRTVTVSSVPPEGLLKNRRGFTENQDLGPGGPINFGGLDTGTVPNALKGVANAIGDFGKMIAAIFSLRGLQVAMGALLAIAAVIMLAHKSGLTT